MPKVIVILGGGMVGGSIPKLLKGNKNVVVKVINASPFASNKIATLRAVTKAGDSSSKTLIPIDKYADEVIIGKAVGIDPTKKSITMEDGKCVEYDILVCATGSQNAGPGQLPIGASIEDAKKFYENLKKTVAKSSNVIIVGGGPVGIELAGEIRDAKPNSNITILQRGTTLCPSKPPLSNKFQTKLKALLKSRNIDVKYSSAKNISMDDFKGAQCLEGEREIELEDGTKLKGDLVFWCVGVSLNTSIYPKEWLDERGQVKVEKTMNVVGAENVFAVGDITDFKETKTLINGSTHAAVVVKNINSIVAGKKMTKEHHPASRAMMVVPVGEQYGVLDAGYFVLGNFATRNAKSKSLFVDRVWTSIDDGKAKGWAQR